MDPADRLSTEHRDLLLRLSLLIGERRGVDEIFAAFASLVRDGLTIDMASLFVATDDPRYLRAVAHYPEIYDAGPPGSVHRTEEIGADQVALAPTGTEYIPRKVGLRTTRSLAERGYERAFATALFVDGTSYGMLTVAKKPHGAFTPEALAFMRLAAMLLATAVRQGIELERARRSAARAGAMNELILALQAGESIDSFFERLPALLRGCLDVDYAGLVLDQGEGYVLVAQTPAGVHGRGTRHSADEAALQDLATEGDFFQFRSGPELPATAALFEAGYRRASVAFLRDAGQLRGMLILARAEPRRFDSDECQFIDLLRSILSQSLANQRRLARTEKAAARARILNETALLLNEGEAIDAIFQRLLELLDQAVELDYVGLLANTGDGTTFRMVGSRPELVRPAGTIVSSEAAGFTAQLTDGSSLYEYEVEGHSEESPFDAAVEAAGMRRTAVLFIRQRGDVEGVLTLARRNAAALTANEQDFLKTLGSMLGQAIANRRRLDAAQTEAARQRLLNELAVLLNKGEAPEAFFLSLLSQLQRVVPFDAMVLLVRSAESARYRVVGSQRSRAFRADQLVPMEDLGEYVLGRIEAGDAVVEGNTLELGGLVADVARAAGTVRGLVAPIRHDRETVGLFLVGRETDLPFSEDHRAFIELVCTLVAQAIANHAKVKEKEEAAIRSGVLSELAVILQGGTRIDEHFEGLSRALLEAVGFDFISITTLDPATGVYHAIRSHELVEDGASLVFSPSALTAIRERSPNGQVQYVTSQSANPVPLALARAGFMHAATAVIAGPDGDEGLLTIGRRDDIAYSNGEMAFIGLVSALLGQASANYRKAHQREAEALRSRVLSELALLVNNGEPIREHFERLRVLLVEGVGFDYCSILVKEGDGAYRAMRSQPLSGEPPGSVSEATFATLEAIPATGAFSRQFGPDTAPFTAPAIFAGTGLERCASFLLTTGQGAEGLLTVGRKVAAEFTPEEMTFFGVVATLLANAAAAERRLTLTAAEAEDRAIIADAAAAAARETTALGIVRGLRATVGRFIPAPFVNFGYLEGEEVVLPSRDGGMERLPIGPYFELALTDGQAAVPPAAARPDELRPGVAAMRGVGLEGHVLTRADSGGSAVGILVAGSRDPDFEPGERELRLFRLIADIVGPAMTNARAVERERREAEEQRVIAAVAAAAAREAEPGALIAALQRPMRAIVPSPLVAFGYLEGDEVVYPRPDGAMVRVPLDAYARQTRELGQVAGPVPRDMTGREELAGLRVNVLSATAVVSGGETVGFLLVGSGKKGFEFGPRELGIFRLVAQIVGPAMENARVALRARLDAEEQRFLAEAASGLARGATEELVVQSLVEPIERFFPGTQVAVFYLQGNLLYGTGTREGLDFGWVVDQSLERGQFSFGKPWPDIGAENIGILERAGIEKVVNTALSARGSNMGLLFVGFRAAAAPVTERELRVLRLIADMAGPAMANARESARRQEEAEEQRILAEAAAAVARAADEQSLATALRDPLRRFVPGLRLTLLYNEGDRLTVYGGRGSFATGRQAHAVLAGNQLTGVTGEAVFDEGVVERLIALGIRRFAATAITSGGESLGVLLAGTRDESFEFGERELRLCRLIADIVGPAMANLRENALRKEEAEDQSILADAAATAAAGATEAEILDGLVRPIRRFVPRARVSFSYAEGGEMWLWDGRHRRPVHSHAQRAISSGQAIGDFHETEVTEATREFLQGARVERWVDTATSAAGSVVGILFVGSPEPGYEFSGRQLRLLRLIAGITGPAMVNAREDARRRQEAEDALILAEIAGVAARAEDVKDVFAALPGLLSSSVPRAVALHGFIDGDSVVYHVTTPEHLELLGAPETRLPLTEVGRAARDGGQGVGTLADKPADRPYKPLGLHAYALTSYQTANRPVGILMVSTSDPEFTFSERTLSLLRRIAQLVGPALETARVEAERARQADLYALMLRSLSEGVILADSQGSPVFTNTFGRAILRAVNPSGRRGTWQDSALALPPEVREGLIGVYDRSEGSRGRAQLVMDGKPRWLDYEMVPLNDPVMKLLFVAADVTADVEHEAEQAAHRTQMEQAQRLAALGELISGVAHELNNPLTAILGFAEVMSLSPENESLTEELTIIQKEALRARNIVRDLLFIARPGTSERAVISVAELIAHIERLRKTAWNQQGIRWEITIQEPCFVWGNEHQLTQVVLNLATNAEHAVANRPERRIAITAATKNGRTEIAVLDTGIGMDEATRSRVFEPFFTTKQGLGTGLGLPLSYSIIQSHQGEIRVDSAPGRGTTFAIDLPAGPEAADSDPTGAEVRAGTVRVLVVDDEPSLRKVCQRLVASMGHECATAENAASAVELAAGQDFDVVLCDYRLATETAGDVLAGFERVAPHLVARTVIATGATTDAGVLALTERYGLRLIAKPYGVDELASIIQPAG